MNIHITRSNQWRHALVILALFLSPLIVKAEERSLHFDQITLTEMADVLQQELGGSIDVSWLNAGLPTDSLVLHDATISVTTDMVPSFSASSAESVGELRLG